MQEKATGRVASRGELKDAASAVTAILAQHFLEGPKGAARAHSWKPDDHQCELNG